MHEFITAFGLALEGGIVGLDLVLERLDGFELGVKLKSSDVVDFREALSRS